MSDPTPPAPDDDPRGALLDLCRGRDLSDEACAELVRLVKHGTERELREVITQLRRLPITRAENIDVDDEATERFVWLCSARAARVAAHRDRIGATAYRLGEGVGAHRVTLDDAERRLYALVNVHDHECPVPLRLVPSDEGRAIMREAFGRGYRAARRKDAS